MPDSSLAAAMETYIGTLKEQLDRLSRPDMLAFMRILLAARERGSRIFIMGNGGSAATASHFVCDFNKGLNQPGQKPFKFICLNDNIPAMLAWGNDQGYADIFVEQLRNLLEDGDCRGHLRQRQLPQHHQGRGVCPRKGLPYGWPCGL